MLEGAKRVSKYEGILRWIPSLLLVPVCAFFIMNRAEYTYVDYFHKVVHLSGQAIFGLMGDFPSIFGGTIMQILIPVLLIIFFMVNYLRKWLQLGFLLLGHTFLNISVYVADAETRKIDLFGPPDQIHDWNWILNFFEAMQYRTDIVSVCVVIAVIFFVIAILIPRIVGY